MNSSSKCKLLKRYMEDDGDKNIEDNQTVTITPDFELMQYLEEYALGRKVSVEKAIELILFDIFKGDRRVQKSLLLENSKGKHEKLYLGKSQWEINLENAARIMVQIAIRVIQEKHAAKEKVAKENDTAKYQSHP